jgi:uncharacterized protein YaeQ
MALKATIFKLDLQIADMDRHYYQDHALTMARHPSENNLRMMLRMLTFVLHAHERLSFCKGVSDEDEPDLWQKSLSDEIELWIDLGQPEEKRIRKACGRAKQTFIYAYQPRSAQVWWAQQEKNLARYKNLSVRLFKQTQEDVLANMAQRNMALQANVQDGQIWLSDGASSTEIMIETLKGVEVR